MIKEKELSWEEKCMVKTLIVKKILDLRHEEGQILQSEIEKYQEIAKKLD